MTALDWSIFRKIPGAPDRNFETLVRSIAMRRFGQFGTIRSLRNQPGVEFYIELSATCPLGKSGDRIGWQCKWFDSDPKKKISTNQRKQIADSLRKAKQHVKGLTKFILVTRKTLSKDDQKWFVGLKTAKGPLLEAQAEDELAALMVDDAEMVRRTFFGDLVLTTDQLLRLHRSAMQVLGRKWIPEVHSRSRVEEEIRRTLGDPTAWSEFSRLGNELRILAQRVRLRENTLASDLKHAVRQFASYLMTCSEDADRAQQLLERGAYDLLTDLCKSEPVRARGLPAEARRWMVAEKAPGSPYAANAIFILKRTHQLFARLLQSITQSLIAVVGEAGSGKSHLAASLTQALDGQPPGVLLFGKDLPRKGTLDDLLRGKDPIGNGSSVSFLTLAHALDAVGRRFGRRIPIVIDGLNETNDARDWKDELARLTIGLQDLPHVVVIGTLRSGTRTPIDGDHFNPKAYRVQDDHYESFQKRAIPDGVPVLELPNGHEDLDASAKLYFEHYKISPQAAIILPEILEHPLTLRIFCETTNPKRATKVHIEALPKSLAALFSKFVDNCSERIVILAEQKISETEIKAKLESVYQLFWNKNAREISISDALTAIGEGGKPWLETLAHFLEQEGLLLRVAGGPEGEDGVVPFHDAFAGYCIARRVVRQQGAMGMPTWLKDIENLEKLSNQGERSNPYSEDILKALAALMPMETGLQLWRVIEAGFARYALWCATNLGSAYVDNDTAAEAWTLIRKNDSFSLHLLDNLRGLSGVPRHPLNAESVDRELRLMAPYERDLLWSEWLRKRTREIRSELDRCSKQWKSHDVRSESDRLQMVWTMWMLTSSVHEIRDHATRTIYYFGKTSPAILLAQAVKSLTVNDPYVPERMLAAAYGALLATNATFGVSVAKDVSAAIADLIGQLDKKAHSPVRHIQTRDYGLGILRWANAKMTGLTLAGKISEIDGPLAPNIDAVFPGVTDGSSEETDVRDALRMDFENYSIGRLVPDRGNYDSQHPGYRKVRNSLLWRVRDLGWSRARFSELDRYIESENGFRGRIEINQSQKIDRYGKKYSLIAHAELSAHLPDDPEERSFRSYTRTWAQDIDPCFPEPPPQKSLQLPALVDPEPMSEARWRSQLNEDWIRKAAQRTTIHDHRGPWVVLDGHYGEKDRDSGREVFVFWRTLLIPKQKESEILRRLRRQDLSGRWLPEKPSNYGVISGELPWSENAPPLGASELGFVVRKIKKRVKIDESNLAFLPWNLLDRKKLPSSMIVEQNVMEKYSAYVPVFSYHRDDRDLDGRSISGSTVDSGMARAMQLRNVPQTFDFEDHDGTRMTMESEFKDERLNESFIYIRKSAFAKHLSKQKMSAILAVWGEKNRYAGGHGNLRSIGKRINLKFITKLL